MVNQSRSPRKSSGNADDAYNPQLDARGDDPFSDSTDGARGAAGQTTNRDYSQEDKETEKSEHSGQIPRREVDDLKSSSTEEERNVSSYTQGIKVDAYKQEREMDRIFEDPDVDN
ncbi:hypothetical protein C2E23DRAFT_856852 [Lenzites betulinus]|nr:hypothetical protein C2E23DRAFT_856852 [Lenzites betulinus]